MVGLTLLRTESLKMLTKMVSLRISLLLKATLAKMAKMEKMMVMMIVMSRMVERMIATRQISKVVLVSRTLWSEGSMLWEQQSTLQSQS
jgi:hypothetical protein